MSKKLNSMPDFTAHLPKYPHDLSQSTTYTCCPGSLNPVYFDLLHHGDKLYFSASEFVRLNPLEAQPLGQVDVHLDYFFVPLTVIYTPSSSMFYQTDDLLSSLVDVNRFPDSSVFPVFNFPGFLVGLNGVFTESISMPSPFYKNFSDGLWKKLDYRYFDVFLKSVYRLFDFFDMCPTCLLDAFHSAENNNYPLFTPWFALAYQAIYQLYFRNDDREPKNYHYNIDKYYAVDSWFEDYTEILDKSIFQLNYVSRPKDYFNSVKVSPIGSQVSMFTNPAAIFNQVNGYLNNTVVTASGYSNGSPSSFSTRIDNATQVSDKDAALRGSAQVRQLFMVEKLLRVIGRTEKNYESQFLAHYGIKVPHDPLHNITHIGHDMMTITPESVISTANTYNGVIGSALGEIGGKASGMLSGRKHEFEAPFHGVFMVISHIIPRRRYVLGLNKLHQLNSVLDFWQPEFDKKGMQPLFRYEAIFNHDFNNMTDRIGWQYAYEQFKRKSDRVMNAFAPTRNSRNAVNTYAPWVIASVPYSNIAYNGTNDYNAVFDASRLLVSPTDLNINMTVPYSPAFPAAAVGESSDLHKPWLIYQTDPFICDFNLYCKKVNAMSEYGEPEL